MAREEAPKAPGRPRSEQCRQAVLEAAANLLEEKPYAAVTIEAIAERAGVSKQTIYKWWKSRPALIMEAYAERSNVKFTEPPKGPVRDRLVAILAQTCDVLRRDNSGAIVAGLIGEAQADEALAAAFRDVFIASRRTVVLAVLTGGVAEGELRADLDIPLAIDLLYGPIWYRLLLRHAPLDEAFARTVVDCVWPALRRAG